MFLRNRLVYFLFIKLPLAKMKNKIISKQSKSKKNAPFENKQVIFNDEIDAELSSKKLNLEIEKIKAETNKLNLENKKIEREINQHFWLRLKLGNLLVTLIAPSIAILVVYLWGGRAIIEQQKSILDKQKVILDSSKVYLDIKNEKLELENKILLNQKNELNNEIKDSTNKLHQTALILESQLKNKQIYLNQIGKNIRDSIEYQSAFKLYNILLENIEAINGPTFNYFLNNRFSADILNIINHNKSIAYAEKQLIYFSYAIGYNTLNYLDTLMSFQIGISGTKYTEQNSNNYHKNDFLIGLLTCDTLDAHTKLYILDKILYVEKTLLNADKLNSHTFNDFSIIIDKYFSDVTFFSLIIKERRDMFFKIMKRTTNNYYKSKRIKPLILGVDSPFDYLIFAAKYFGTAAVVHFINAAKNGESSIDFNRGIEITNEELGSSKYFQKDSALINSFNEINYQNFQDWVKYNENGFSNLDYNKFTKELNKLKPSIIKLIGQ